MSASELGYLLLNALEENLKLFDQPLSAPAALDILGHCRLNRIGPKNSATYVESITPSWAEQIELLQGLGLAHLSGKKFLGQILEPSSM